MKAKLHNISTTVTLGSNNVVGSVNNNNNASARNQSIARLLDVDTTVLLNGSVLVYSESINKWISTTLLSEQDIEGGHY